MVKADGISHTVLVQAAANETGHMLGITDTTKSVAGVVDRIDFERPEKRAQLERLVRHPKFMGVRPVTHDIPNVNWMLRDHTQWDYRAIINLGFNALGFPQHLDNFRTLL